MNNIYVICKIFQEFVRGSNLPASYDHLDGGFWRGIVVRSNLKGDIMCIVFANPRGYANEDMLTEQQELATYLSDNNCHINSLYYHPRYE